MTAPWWATLAAAEAAVRCGDQQHLLRWEAGRLTARAHPDAEGELVLGVLGGDQPECIRLLRAWGEHSDDLDVLMLGPRSARDTLAVDARDTGQLHVGSVGWFAYAPRAGPVPGGIAPGMPLTWGSLWFRTLRSFAVNARGLPRSSVVSGPGSAARAAQVARLRPVPARALISRHGPGRPSPFPGMGQDLDRDFARRAELLELFALGPAFQFRLCATVAAAWSQRDPGRARPALTAALAGRLAPATATWLQVSPDEVRVSLAEGPGGLALDAEQWRAGMWWVAAVWAAGLALIDGNVVVEVIHAEYPKADVLALTKPGSEPVALAVQCESARGSPQGSRWRVIRP